MEEREYEFKIRVKAFRSDSLDDLELQINEFIGKLMLARHGDLLQVKNVSYSHSPNSNGSMTHKSMLLYTCFE